MSVTIFIISAIVFLLGVLIYNRLKKNDYVPTPYEKELIDYFNEIALKSEYYDNPERIIKWGKPMKLFVYKDSLFTRQMAIVERTIESINKLATDGFNIELTEDMSKSNAILYLCKREQVKRTAPEFYQIFAGDAIDVEVAGFAYSQFDRSNCSIVRASVFIDIEEAFELQEVAVLEEITQSIGLPNDSEKYSRSVFYENKVEDKVFINEYSSIDRDVIRLLYHPKIKSGFNIKRTERAIKKILKAESKNSNL